MITHNWVTAVQHHCCFHRLIWFDVFVCGIAIETKDKTRFEFNYNNMLLHYPQLNALLEE